MSQPTPALPSRRQPRPCRSRIVIGLVFLVLAGAGTGLYFFWLWFGDLDDFTAELDRVDPGWRLETIEANRKVLSSAQNSALHILSITNLLGGQSVVTPGTEKMFEGLSSQIRLNEQQTAILEKRFEVLRKAVVEARKLTDMSDGRYPMTYSANITVNYTDASGVSELLLWDAARRVQAFDGEGALESCLALQHVARSFGDEPLLISLLVRGACNSIAVSAIERTLAQGYFTETSEAPLKRLQATLARELAEPALVTALRGERAWSHQFFPGRFTRQPSALLRLHTELIEVAKLPAEQRLERARILEKKAADASAPVRNAIASAVKVMEADLRTQANFRCAMAGLAAERFRLAHKSWPQTLEDLVKAGLLDAVPIDPYDAKPLRLKRTDYGLVIYSVGWDRTDNNGNVDRERPRDAGTDLGFRLWNVSERRQPPNPKIAEVEPPE
jgi:hypothetical protein